VSVFLCEFFGIVFQRLYVYAVGFLRENIAQQIEVDERIAQIIVRQNTAFKHFQLRNKDNQELEV